MLGIKQKDHILNFHPSGLVLNQSILDVFELQKIIERADAQDLRLKLKTNEEVENYLLKNRLVSRETINKAYSIILKLPFIGLENIRIPEEAKAVIPEKIARKFSAVPFAIENNLLKVAIARPSELMVGFKNGLIKLLQEKQYDIELFITGDTDFESAVAQYTKKPSGILVNRGSYPVVYLRNQDIATENLKKLPRDFIAKNRMVIFGKNAQNEYQIACEKPNDPLTLKTLDYLRKNNNISLEIFAAAKEDIDYALDNYSGAKKPKVIADIKDKIVANTKKQSRPINFWEDSNTEEFEVDEIPRPELNEKADEALESVKVEVLKEEEKAPENVEPAEVQTSSTDKPEVAASTVPAESTISANFDSTAAPRETSDEETDLMEDKVITEADLSDIVKDGYVPKILSGILNFALNRKSSDVHIEPETRVLRVRCRIDGILRDIVKIPLKFHPPLLSRIKVLSKLKLDESRIPQDGRFESLFKNHSVDFRVSTLPTVHGEKAVIRILDKDQTILSLEDLGMQGSAFEKTVAAISKPFGTILSTGPTGSGKSTTLYAILNRISIPGINIVTLEDPVEYDIPGINQCQVKPEIGFTFANGLRSVLRQDPNVIMVGEVRDAETANMVTHASLTGHLVLSTLHTNDSASALPRLINMGVEPFLITSSINIVVGQRLVRRICPKCREEMKVPSKLMVQIQEELQKIAQSKSPDVARLPKDFRLYYGKGCSDCHQGYKGRIGIFEVFDMNEEIEDLAVAKRPSDEIKQAAIRSGMITMKQDGIIKAMQGLTTIDEVFQAVVAD